MPGLTWGNGPHPCPRVLVEGSEGGGTEGGTKDWALGGTFSNSVVLKVWSWTSSFCTAWELVRNAHSGAPPQTY